MDMELNDSSDKVRRINSRNKSRSKILSSSSDEDNEYSNIDVEEVSKWQEIRDGSPIINEYSGEDKFLIEGTDCNNPYALYKLFFTDAILDILVEETNKFAAQCINYSSYNSKPHQLDWKPVTREEMNSFIGILLIMGVIQVPETRLYWSEKDMYTNARIKKAMKLNRFLSILKYFHFSYNIAAKTQDRLNSIRNIIRAIVDSFKNAINPGKNIVINESMVPWRGRLGFRQYKLYKLCLPEGYTYNIEIYFEKNETIVDKSHSHDVVMRLLNGLLFEGRILFTDSYYTSVPLAEELLQKNTFICGTVKINQKFLPPQAKENQKRGGIMSFENRNGVKFLKWTDERPICMLTTSKNHRCNFVQGKNGKVKPDTVFDYNIAKKGVDISDQISGYYSCLRKTIEWHQKVVIELICGTSLVNAWYIHKRWGNKNMNMLQFREDIINCLLANEEMANENQIPSHKHVLQSYEGSARESRKRCKECYKNLSKKNGRDYATKNTTRVRTYCMHCESQPALCLKCFNKLHKSQ